LAGTIEELIRKHNVSGFQFLLQGPNCARGDNSLNSEELHCIDICAERDLSGQQSMAAAVAWQKCKPYSRERSDMEYIRRISKRSRYRHFLDISKLCDLVKAAASNDSNSCL